MEVVVITNDQTTSSHQVSTIQEMNVLQVALVHQKEKNNINAPMCSYQELECITDAIKAYQNGTFKQHYDKTIENNNFPMLINTAHTLQAMKVIDLCVARYFPQEIQSVLCADMIKKITSHSIENQEPEPFVGHPCGVYALAITSNDNYLVSGSDIVHNYNQPPTSDPTNNLLIWDYAKKTIKHSLKGHNYRITAIRISNDNTKAITGNHQEHGPIHIWDIQQGTLLHSLPTLNYPGIVTALALSKNNKTLAVGLSTTGAKTKTILICDTNSYEVTHAIVEKEQDYPTIYHSTLAISKDGTTVFSGGRGHSYDDNISTGPAINIYNTETGTKINSFHLHYDDINEIALSNDETKIISGGFYRKKCNNLFISNATTGEIINTLEGHTDHIFSLAINKDNSLIAAGSRYSNNSLFIYDAHTGKILYKLGKGFITTVTFSNDDNKVITGGNNNTHISQWTINSPELIYIKNKLNCAQIKLLYRWYCMQKNKLTPTLNQQNGDVHIYNSLPQSIKDIVEKIFFVKLEQHAPEKDIEELDIELDPSMFVL
jgi:WD40 repeat protein